MMNKNRIRGVEISNHSQNRRPDPLPGKAAKRTCLVIAGLSAYMRHDFISGFNTEHGNQSFRCQGKDSSRRAARAREPKRSTGADQRVVAKKAWKHARAKGLSRSALDTEQPQGRILWTK